MADYRKSLEAERDLIQIWKHIAQNSNSAATQLIDRLHGQMRELAAFPGMGRVRTELSAVVRSFPVDDFLAFYRENEIGIEVIRVRSCSRSLTESSTTGASASFSPR